MHRRTVAAAVLAVGLAADAHGQGSRQWTITPDMEGRLVAGKAAAEVKAARSPWWVGEPAPLFVSISREICEVGGEEGEESWLMFTCSADGPEDIRLGFWAARLDLLLFDASGQLIYASENEEAVSAGGLCAFGSVETWLDDELITMSFIEFPRELEPATAAIYVASDERSEVRLLTDAYATVYRPIEPAEADSSVR